MMKGGLYRSRLNGDIDPESQRFIGSLDVDAELLQYEVDSSLAHVIMLREEGWMSKEEAAGVISALEKMATASVPSEGFEDIHEFVETKVTQLTSKETGGRLHTARSRNDQVATITRMMCRDRLLQLARETERLIDSLLELSRRYSAAPLLAYTHLQRAQLQTLGHHLQSYAEPLIRDVGRLLDCFDRANECPLGASAIAGSTIRVDRRRTSELLGFSSLVMNCEDAIESRDYAVEAMFVQTLLLIELSRMAEDLMIWSTSEFSYFELPDRLSSPSSAMPQKKNADVLEMVRSDAALAIARLVRAMVTLKGLTSGYNRDLQSVKAALADSFGATLDDLSMVRRCLEGGSFDTTEMRRKAEESDLFALPLAEWLVKRHSIPFRQAHGVAGKISEVLASRKGRFAELSSDELVRLIEQNCLGLEVGKVEGEVLRRYLRPEAILEVTATEGGPSKKEVLANYKSLVGKVNVLKIGRSKRLGQLAKAKKRLRAEARRVR
jgi:argininosuccinate lyase